MNTIDPVAREADAISLEFIERLEKEADGDPMRLLQLLDIGLTASGRHQVRLKEKRLQTAAGLRETGVPMTEIAEAANVNDSYLSRQLISNGADRRVDRTRSRRRRPQYPSQGVQA